MLRYANSSDIPALKLLLKNVFGTSERYLDLFFHLAFDDNNVCLYEYEHQIVSMAFLLPAQIELDTEICKATYLYGCATLKQFRNQGFMRRIIEKSFADTCHRGEAALVVMPASETLYSYYENCGFQPYFHLRERHFHLRDFHWRNDREEYALQEISAREYAQQRRRLLTGQGVVHWPLNHFLVLEAEAAGNGDGFYAITVNTEPRAYCIVRQRESWLEITEWIGDELADVQGLFFRTFDYEHIVIYDPNGDKKSALIRFNPSFIAHKKNEKGYGNIFLD